MKGEKPIRILHVDDEKNQLEFTKLFLEEIDNNLIVDSAETPEEAVKLQEKNKYDCVISDYKMLKMTGIELAQKVREKSSIPIILYTGQGSEEVAESAFEAGVDDYLRKENEPSHYQVLAKRVRQNVEKYRTDLLYRKVVEESRDGLLIIINDKLAFINDAASKLFGEKTPKKLIGKKINELFEEKKEALLQKLEECCKTPNPSIFETKYRTNKKTFKTAELSVSKIKYLGDDAYLCFIRDITQKKRNMEQLNAIHKQATKLSTLQTIEEISKTTLDIMESLFENQTNSFQIIEKETLKTLGTRGTTSIKPTLSLKGSGMTEKAAREKRSILVNDLRKNSTFSKASPDSLSKLSIPAVNDDETIAVLNVESPHINEFTEEDRKLLETLAYHVAFAINLVTQQVFRSQQEAIRLNYALGRLEEAETITNLVKKELQGSLHSIKNASEILKDEPEILLDIADIIDRKAEHAVNISEAIHEKISKSSLDMEILEVNNIVRQALSSFYIPSNIDILARYTKDLLVITIEKSKIIRVLDNIVRNAIEAMKDGGLITINVLKKGDFAGIEIKDTGEGVPEDIKDKLFQPFITTRPNHDGLGLAYSKKIIESSGGKISLRSEIGKGTTVIISIPIIKK